MTEAVNAIEAMAFCLAPAGSTADEFQPLVDKAVGMVEAAVGHTINAQSPAPLRLAALIMVAQANNGFEMDIEKVMPWIAPYKQEAA